MAITVTQTIAQVAGAGGTTIVISPSSTAAGALLVVCTETNGLITISGVADDKSNTYTQAKTFTAPNGFICEQWESHNSTAGVTAITVTYSGATGATTANASGYELAGAHLTSPVGQSSTGGTSQTATVINESVTSFTPNATDSIIIASSRISAAPTSYASPGGYTVLGGATRHQTAYLIRTGAGNETAPIDVTYGASGTRGWGEIAVEYLVAAATTAVKDVLGVGIIPFAR